MPMSTFSTTRYAFALHNRRISTLTSISALTVVVFGTFALLSNFHVLPAGLDTLIGLSYILSVIGFIFLLPLLVLRYISARSGEWIEPDKVRVHYPGENEQQMEWSE